MELNFSYFFYFKSLHLKVINLPNRYTHEPMPGAKMYLHCSKEKIIYKKIFKKKINKKR